MDPLQKPTPSNDTEEKKITVTSDADEGSQEESKASSDLLDMSSDTSSEESKSVDVSDSSDASSDTPSEADKPSFGDSASESESSSESSKPAADAAPEAPSTPAETPASDPLPDMSSDSPVADSAKPSTPPPAMPDSMSVGGGMATAGVAGGMIGAGSSKKKMGMMMLIVGLVIVVLLGGAAAAYYMIMNKPQNVLDMSLSNAFSKDKSKTVAFEGAVTATDKNNKQVANVTYTGAADQEGPMQVSANIDAVVTTVTVDLRTQDASTYYLKVGGLSGLPQLLGISSQAEAKALAPIVAALNNQWFEINQSLLKQINSGNGVTKLSDADRQKIVDAYKKNKFLVVKSTLPDQTIKTVATHHYQVVVDKAKLQAFVAAIKDAKLDSIKLTSDQYTSLSKSLSGMKAQSDPVDVWIGKSDRMIRQVGLTSTDKGATMSFRLTVDSYNQAVKVDKPANAKSLLDVLGQLFGGGTGTGANPLTTLPLPSGLSL